MAIELNGTTGITTPDITSEAGLTVDGVSFASGAPANTLVTTSGGNVGIGTSSPSTKLHLETGSGDLITTMAGASRTWQLRNQSDGNLGLYDSTAAAWRTFWDTSGNVGIGTTSPATYGTTNLEVNGKAGGSYVVVKGSNNSIIGELASDGAIYLSSKTAHPLIFRTTDVERARITPAGYLLVGSSTTNSSNATTKVQITYSSNTGPGLLIADSSIQNNSTFASFVAGTTRIGSITANGTTAVLYNTVSDYRLKENVVGVTGASARVQQLNPVRFNFIADPDRTVDGFLAHEVQDVVPEAISGTKDATEMVDVHDEDGNVTGQEERPVYQGIDQSKLVPLLTAALQEALTKIETLEARVAALEAA